MASNELNGVKVEMTFENITQTRIGVRYSIINSNAFAVKVYVKNDDTGTWIRNGDLLAANSSWINEYYLQGNLQPGTSYLYIMNVLRNSNSAELVKLLYIGTTESPPFGFTPYYNFSFTPYYNFSFTPFSFTPAPPPAAPSNLSVSSITPTSLTLNWDAVSAATNYEIYLNSNLLTTVNSSTTSYNYSGLTSNTTYILGVKSKNANGTSSLATINGTTAIAPGRVYENGSWRDVTQFKRYDSATSSWKPITVFRRYNSSTGTWDSITN